MPIKEGKIGKHRVKVMRDSGCSGVMVKSKFVESHQKTGIVRPCKLIDGTIKQYPVAMVSIDTPYYVGTVRAFYVEDPMCDVIIGNIEGARDVSDPDPNWGKFVDEGHVNVCKSEMREDRNQGKGLEKLNRKCNSEDDPWKEENATSRVNRKEQKAKYAVKGNHGVEKKGLGTVRKPEVQVKVKRGELKMKEQSISRQDGSRSFFLEDGAGSEYVLRIEKKHRMETGDPIKTKKRKATFS
jgi:hypothetical protein